MNIKEQDFKDDYYVNHRFTWSLLKFHKDLTVFAKDLSEGQVFRKMFVLQDHRECHSE